MTLPRLGIEGGDGDSCSDGFVVSGITLEGVDRNNERVVPKDRSSNREGIAYGTNELVIIGWDDVMNRRGGDSLVGSSFRRAEVTFWPREDKLAAKRDRGLFVPRFGKVLEGFRRYVLPPGVQFISVVCDNVLSSLNRHRPLRDRDPEHGKCETMRLVRQGKLLPL